MPELLFSKQSYADHMCLHLAMMYPAYRFEAVKLPRNRLWRIATYCKATGAFLQYAKR